MSKVLMVDAVSLDGFLFLADEQDWVGPLRDLRAVGTLLSDAE